MKLVRIFDPTRYGTTATSFRSYGPIHRFDHHSGSGPNHLPGEDPICRVYYAAFRLSSCLVEVFGDTGMIEFRNWHVASPKLNRSLTVLDLRRNGAMRAGSVAALAKVPDRSPSQAWSRYFHDNPSTYTNIDGILFFNAHNDDDALCFYERADGALDCPPSRVTRLDDPGLRPRILEIAAQNNLVVL